MRCKHDCLEVQLKAQYRLTKVSEPTPNLWRNDLTNLRDLISTPGLINSGTQVSSFRPTVWMASLIRRNGAAKK